MGKAQIKQTSKRARLEKVMGKKRRSEALLPKFLLVINQILPIVANPLCTGVNNSKIVNGSRTTLSTENIPFHTVTDLKHRMNCKCCPVSL